MCTSLVDMLKSLSRTNKKLGKHGISIHCSLRRHLIDVSAFGLRRRRKQRRKYDSATPTHNIRDRRDGDWPGRQRHAPKQRHRSVDAVANGSFTFGTKLNSGSSYSVTVTAQPSVRLCSCKWLGQCNGSGFRDRRDVHCQYGDSVPPVSGDFSRIQLSRRTLRPVKQEHRSSSATHNRVQYGFVALVPQLAISAGATISAQSQQL